MHQYDVASKILMETCRDEIIRYFAGIDVKKSILIKELPQETVSLKRSDFPVMVTNRNGKKMLIIFELQTKWDKTVPLSLLDHRTRYQIKYNIDPLSFVILLKPSKKAENVYKNKEVRFTFQLVKVYEMDAQEIVDNGPLCLMPFVPLMKHGRKLLTQADDLIYQSGHSRIEKADLLTSMAILSGIVSKDLPIQLINRRKDIMIESAAYDIIKQDGMLLEAREMVIEAIETRFKKIPDDISSAIRAITDRNILKSLLRNTILCNDIEILRTKILNVK